MSKGPRQFSHCALLELRRKFCKSRSQTSRQSVFDFPSKDCDSAVEYRNVELIRMSTIVQQLPNYKGLTGHTRGLWSRMAQWSNHQPQPGLCNSNYSSLRSICRKQNWIWSTLNKGEETTVTNCRQQQTRDQSNLVQLLARKAHKYS